MLIRYIELYPILQILLSDSISAKLIEESELEKIKHLIKN